MEDVDPYEWSVDQVIYHLCQQQPPIWSHESHIKPIPGLNVLQKALQDNDIDGESLLSLEDETLRTDIGLQSFGQRRAVHKVIVYLRDLSVQYITLKPVTTLMRPSEERKTRETSSDIDFEPRKRRRIAPTLVSTARPVQIVPSDSENEDLPSELEDLLERHQQYTDESIYGGSQTSGSDSSSLFREHEDLIRQVEDEEKEVQDRKESENQPPLTESEVEKTIEDTCQTMRSSWILQMPPRVVKRAHREWRVATNLQERATLIQHHQARLVLLRARIVRIKEKIKQDQFFDAADIIARCGNLEATVEDITEERHYLSVLGCDFPPPRPPTEQQPRTRVKSGVDESGSYDIAESESDFIDEDDDLGSRVTSVGSSTVRNGERIASSGPATRTEREGITTPSRPTTEKSTTEELVQSQHRHSLRLPQGIDLDIDLDSIDSDYDSDLDRTPALPISRYRTKGGSLDTAIDLGSSPAEDEDMHLPVQSSSPVRKKLFTIDIPSRLLKPDKTHFPPVEETRQISWKDIAEAGNKQLALAKEIYFMDPNDHVRPVFEFGKSLEHKEVMPLLRGVLQNFQSPWFPGVSDSSHDDAALFAYCFICYVCCCGWGCDFKEIKQSTINFSLSEVADAARNFHTYLLALCQYYLESITPGTYFASQKLRTKVTNRSQSLESDTTTTDEENLVNDNLNGERDPPHLSARKHRKRVVKQSQEAMDYQRHDLARVEQQEQRRAELMETMQAMQPLGEQKFVPVNTIEPLVYLDQHIARHAKEHQISGIQFMWRELIEDAKHQGCLLAHTMGLGKTMQVISVLVSIAQCNQSPIQSVRELVPEHLRLNNTMILCPASLLDNWRDEILMWTPDKDLLGGIYLISGGRDRKITLLRTWAARNGLAILSYETFRSLHQSRGLDEETRSEVQQYLLKTPSLVVADEAHKLKNPTSAIAKLTKGFRTTSRIALTGSPLNNHLVEYHTMIDWIAQGYLGSMVQFKARFSEPINDGLYTESTGFEKRRSLRQLHKLKQILAPKINRADISAIIADMPQKTEFYITITLTQAQHTAYKMIAEHLLGYYRSTGLPLANARLWSWISILSWLCNHPSCLIKKLRERNSNNLSARLDDDSVAPSPADSGEADEVLDQAPENTNISNDTVVTSLLPNIEQIFRDTAVEQGLSDDDPALSHRSLVTYQILTEANRVGDKTLLFSHSIPTLNYLESMIRGRGLKYLRIDGSTDAQKRQEYTKQFNDANSDIDAFLISTRAGGLGLNLQGANRVIIYDFGFNPSWEEQAIGRAYRFRQTRPVYVYRFRTGGTFENAMYNTSVFKTQLFSRVVDYKNVMRHASKTVEQYLFVPTEVPMEDFSEARGKDPDVLDRLIDNANDDYIRNIILTETFQREDENDELTPEERKSAEEELAKEELQKNNPVAFQQLMREQDAQRAMTASQAPQLPYTSEWVFNVPVVPSQPWPLPMQTRDDIDLERM